MHIMHNRKCQGMHSGVRSAARAFFERNVGQRKVGPAAGTTFDTLGEFDTRYRANSRIGAFWGKRVPHIFLLFPAHAVHYYSISAYSNRATQQFHRNYSQPRYITGSYMDHNALLLISHLVRNYFKIKKGNKSQKKISQDKLLKAIGAALQSSLHRRTYSTIVMNAFANS